MSLENLLVTIEGAIAVGALVGLLIGVFLPNPKAGCFVLLIVPIAMVFFVASLHDRHPENLRSTSGLDFIFGPLWPSLGAVGAYFFCVMVRSHFDKRV